MNTQGMFEDLWRVLLADNGDHTVHFFDDLLASTPNDVDAWLGRSALLGKLKKYPEAIESFTRTIQVASGNDLAMAYAGRALNYYALQNFQKAFDDCERALELNPNEAIFWKTQGILLCHLDKNIDALSAFTKGLELNPKDEKMIGLRKFLEETFQDKLILQLEKSEFFFVIR
jgi:tetratricopeptide (TPR) repeat protein